MFPFFISACLPETNRNDTRSCPHRVGGSQQGARLHVRQDRCDGVPPNVITSPERGKEGFKRNAVSFQCNDPSTRFRRNPSRLPARPSGLWGLTARRGQAKRTAVINAEPRSDEPALKRWKRRNADREKLLDTRGPHISLVCPPRSARG
jgi:hypothetical protein